MASLDAGRSAESSRSNPARFERGSKLFIDALKVLVAIYLVSVLSWVIAALHLPIEPKVFVAAAGILAVIFGLVLRGLPQHRHQRFGFANMVTALRAGLISLVGAVILFSDAFGDQQISRMVWATGLASMFALALDGVDGYLARRFRQESMLGARFDMEVDAFLILMLSLAAFILEKAGPWVLLIGALRYLFVVAQWIFPRLRRDLQASFRRKLICVVQVGVLCAVMLPIVQAPLSAIFCAMALGLLVYSFAVDTAYLLLGKDTTA